MSSRERERDGKARREFRPSLDGRGLEERVLLSGFQVNKINVGGTVILNPPKTAGAGSAVVVTSPSGQRFYINIAGHGTVRAVPTPGGAYNLIVAGTDSQSELTINPLLQRRGKSIAHTFSPGNSTRNGLVKISGINVQSGAINAILGYHTAVLTGPVVVGGNAAVDRIAFQAVESGGSISTGGSINTLDVLTNAVFNKGVGLYVGQDLNFMLVGGSIAFQNGANFNVRRDVGLVTQPLKGTQTGINATTSTLTTNALAGGIIQGDLVIGPGSRFIINRSLDAQFITRGAVYGVTAGDTSRLSIANGGSNFQSLGGFFAFNG